MSIKLQLVWPLEVTLMELQLNRKCWLFRCKTSCHTWRVFINVWVFTFHSAFYNHDIFGVLKIEWLKTSSSSSSSSSSLLSLWQHSFLVVSLSHDIMAIYSVLKWYFWRMRLHPRLSTAVAAFQTAPFFLPFVAKRSRCLQVPFHSLPKHFVILKKTTNV